MQISMTLTEVLSYRAQDGSAPKSTNGVISGAVPRPLVAGNMVGFGYESPGSSEDACDQNRSPERAFEQDKINPSS